MFFFQYPFRDILPYVSNLGEQGLVVYDYLFTCQRKSQSFPDIDFFFAILLPIL